MNKATTGGSLFERSLNDVRFKAPDGYIEMLAFLIAEEKGELRLRDLIGTWIVSAKDVVDRSEWEHAPTGFEGKPVRVRIRANSTVRQIREFTLLPSDRPILYPDPEKPSAVVGLAELNSIGSQWAAKLGFTPGDEMTMEMMKSGGGKAGRGHTSACCWESGEWAMDCSPDDCM